MATRNQLTDEKQEKTEGSPNPSGSSGKNETILIVEDEPLVLDMNREILDSRGYCLYCAGSGLEAVELYTEKYDHIDLVILDMHMPDMSGRETFDHLRRINPRIKILLATGHIMDDQVRTLIDLGCSGFIQKPFGPDDLRKKVRNVLDDTDRAL